MCCQSHTFILATALGWNRQKISHITAPQKYVVGKKIISLPLCILSRPV